MYFIGNSEIIPIGADIRLSVVPRREFQILYHKVDSDGGATNARKFQTDSPH